MEAGIDSSNACQIYTWNRQASGRDRWIYNPISRSVDHYQDQSSGAEPENRLTLEEWNGGDQIWLVDLIAPFANADNRHREVMIADLISKPLAGQEFRFHQTDPLTGKRAVQTVGADAGAKLKEALVAAAGQHP
jgi:cytolysin-activating lysine-acyltransferase